MVAFSGDEKLTDEEGKTARSVFDSGLNRMAGPILTDEEKKLRADDLPRDEGNMEQVRDCLAQAGT